MSYHPPSNNPVRFSYNGTQGTTVQSYNRPQAYTFAANNHPQYDTPVRQTQGYQQYQGQQLPQYQNQPKQPSVGVKLSNNQIQSLQSTPGNYSRYQSQAPKYRLDNIPEAKQDDFKPGCFGKGQKGIVYQSHEKTTSFC